MSMTFASVERPRINPLCSWDAPGATLGSTWRRTALQSILLSALVMFNGLMLLGGRSRRHQRGWKKPSWG
eukprot:1583171-Pyramimonas_sp.AAC.1